MATRDHPPIGYLLRRLRTAAALSQEALAERAGLSVRAVSDLERGVHQAPRLETVRMLADALAAGETDRADLLLAARPGLATASTATASRGRPLGGLPLPPTRLIGREQEVATLCGLLTRDGPRLVTLTGPGGTGKTRLAQAVAADLPDTFVDGIFFVDLAPLADPTLLLPQIVATLGVREAAAGGRSPRDAVIAYLEGKRVLLLLDNFEHLLAAAPVIADLLTASAGLTILATSRASLRLRREYEFAIQPLQLPDLARLPALDRLAGVEAVALFVQRAQAARPDFALTVDNARAVAAICVRLDGLPLAIELAATWVKVLPPTALLARLEQRLPLLTGGARDLPARQQTLWSTIAWSYDLLTPDEQKLFRWMAVFVGGATLEVLEAVVDPDSGLDVLAGLTGLVEQNMLRYAEGPGGEPRFRMLETIREYALEQLETSGEAQATRQRHAACYVRLAERVAHTSRGAIFGNPQDVAELEAEYANMRAALTWLTQERNAKVALRLAAALGGFWNLRGHLDEGRLWLEQTLANDDGTQPRVRAAALIWLGTFVGQRGQPARGFALLEEAEALARAAGDMPGVASAMICRAFAELHGRRDPVSAAALGEEGLALYEAAEIPWGVAASRLLIALAAQHRGDTIRAEALYEQLLTDFRLHGGDEYVAAQTLHSLGVMAQARGEDVRASSLFAEALGRFRALGDLGSVAWCLEAVAATSGGDHPEQAARLFAAADTLRAAINVPLPTPERPEYDRAVAFVRSAMGEPAFDSAWSDGTVLQMEDAIAEASNLASAP
jgi:predicted ATPase/transcriptional regulator with XRE-family HTH domain